MRNLVTCLVAIALAITLATMMCAGCAAVPRWSDPLNVRAAGGERVYAFDTDGDRRADFWQYQNSAGRKHAIAYAAGDTAEPGLPIELDEIDAATCPHFMIVLDGVPFELVDELYQAGHFRFFHPPARVICCYPGMTDLALAELFHTESCAAFQALHFDRQNARLVGGSGDYLDALNSPWVAEVDYRCSFWLDALVYLDPQTVFDHELRGMLRTFRAVDTGEARAYSVGTAGLGTRGGREAILKYLRTVDRLCEQIIHERRGQVKLTLTADHGHNLTPNHKISFRKTLAAAGYRQSKSLRQPNDVVVVPYGLVTYAEFYTADPAGVADCLLKHEDVELACYPTMISIRLGSKHFDLLVRDRTEQAQISQTPEGYYYDSSQGDPLHLAPIIAQLRAAGHVTSDGIIDPAALFEATIEHEYPDPLARLWRAFHDLVDNPPDLIVNLRDGACYGSRFFHTMIGHVASTHGGLNRANSTTFALTTLGPLPPTLRTRDLLPALEQLRSPPDSQP